MLCEIEIVLVESCYIAIGVSEKNNILMACTSRNPARTLKKGFYPVDKKNWPVLENLLLPRCVWVTSDACSFSCREVHTGKLTNLDIWLECLRHVRRSQVPKISKRTKILVALFFPSFFKNVLFIYRLQNSNPTALVLLTSQPVM